MGLAALALWGCARAEPPRGGPEDRLPPFVIETVPDTFAVVEAGLKKIRFRFSERISARPASGSMDDAVLVSPSTGNVRVSPGRDGIEVSLGEGLLPDQVYRITLLPVISDMFSNRLRGPFDLVITTGGPPVPNVIAGAVEDRITGRPVEGARVEALFAADGDSVVHWNFTDADGIFSLRFAPTGTYRLRAFEDRNRNGEVDANEPQAQLDPGQLQAPVDTSYSLVSLIEPDTSAARLLSVEVIDSLAVTFLFDDFVDPLMDLGAAAATVVDSASGGTIQVELLHEDDFRIRRAAGDTASVGEPVSGDPPKRVGLSGLQLPSQSVYVVLGSPLGQGTPYSGRISGIRNVAGTGEGGGERTFSWEPPPPDSLPVDSIPGLPGLKGGPDPDTVPAVDTLLRVNRLLVDRLLRVDALPGPPGRG